MLDSARNVAPCECPTYLQGRLGHVPLAKKKRVPLIDKGDE